MISALSPRFLYGPTAVNLVAQPGSVTVLGNRSGRLRKLKSEPSDQLIIIHCINSAGDTLANAFAALINPPQVNPPASTAGYSGPSSSGGSSYSGGSSPNVGTQVMQNYNRAVNTGITGLYSVAPQITVNPYNHSAQLPITVAYRKDGPTGSYSMQFFIKSDDPTRPLTGTATMFIGENDPPVGEKTVNMWIQASRSTNATVSVLGHTGGFSIQGYGQNDHTEVDVP